MYSNPKIRKVYTWYSMYNYENKSKGNITKNVRRCIVSVMPTNILLFSGEMIWLNKQVRTNAITYVNMLTEKSQTRKKFFWKLECRTVIVWYFTQLCRTITQMKLLLIWSISILTVTDRQNITKIDGIV